MIKSFDTKQSSYEREESISYNGTWGSIWVRYENHHFSGRNFVPGSRPTREQVIDAFDLSYERAIAAALEA